MVGSRRVAVIAVIAVLGIALGTLVPPAIQQFGPGSEAGGDVADAEERCARTVVDFVAELQELIDDAAGMTGPALVEAFADDALASSSTRFNQRIAALGCDEDTVAELLAEGLGTLEGGGLVGELVAEVVRASVAGDPPDLPTEMTVTTDDDLGAVVALAAPGSVLRLTSGEHRITEALVLPASLSLQGAGVGATRISSTAPEAAIVKIGSGRLRIAGLTLAHGGTDPASVLVIQDGSYELEGVRVTGGVADTDGAGGAGIVLGPEEHDASALPAPAGRQRVLDDVEVDRNAGAGVLVRGAETPDITAARVTGNGACGLCFVDAAAGTVRGSVLAGNLTGIAVSDTAAPDVGASVIERNEQAGVVIGDDGRGHFRGNEIVGNGALGVVVNDRGDPTFDDNEIREHAEAGAVLGGASAGTLRDNTLAAAPVGVWLDGTARPVIDGNRVVGGDSAGIIYAGTSGGEAVDNEIDGIPVGIEVRDEAVPELRANTVTGSEEAALVFRDDGAGQAVGNACSGGSPRIVLLDRASPTLDGNDCRSEDLR